MKPHYRSLVFLLAVSASLAGCGTDSPTGPTPPAADVTIGVVGINGSNSFSPNPTTITAGQSVTWKNNDSAVHRMVQDAAGFATGDVSAGQSTAAITLSTRGTIAYHCSIHPAMTGTIVVQ